MMSSLGDGSRSVGPLSTGILQRCVDACVRVCACVRADVCAGARVMRVCMRMQRSTLQRGLWGADTVGSDRE